MSDAQIGSDDRPRTGCVYRVDRPTPAKTYSPTTKRFLKRRQQQRVSDLIAEGHTVRVGPCGVTVFRDFGGAARWTRPSFF